jgi:hypothetical protein
MFMLSLALAAVTLATGCSGGTGGAASDTSTSPSPTTSASGTPSASGSQDEQSGPPSPAAMQAALPTADQVPQADPDPATCSFGKVTRSCPERRGTTYASVYFTLAGTDDKTDIKQQDGTHWQAETVSMEVYRYADVQLAAGGLAEATKGARRSAGDVDIAPRTMSGNQYSLGIQGTSAFHAVEVGHGVKGYLVDSDIRYTSPEGRTSAPYDNAFGIVRDDNYLIVISVSRWASSGGARELADKLLEEYVARVA